MLTNFSSYNNMPRQRRNSLNEISNFKKQRHSIQSISPIAKDRHYINEHLNRSTNYKKRYEYSKSFLEQDGNSLYQNQFNQPNQLNSSFQRVRLSKNSLYTTNQKRRNVEKQRLTSNVKQPPMIKTQKIKLNNYLSKQNNNYLNSNIPSQFIDDIQTRHHVKDSFNMTDKFKQSKSRYNTQRHPQQTQPKPQKPTVLKQRPISNIPKHQQKSTPINEPKIALNDSNNQRIIQKINRIQLLNRQIRTRLQKMLVNN